MKKPQSSSRTIRRIAIVALIIGVGAFVAYNLYASQDIETVDQSAVVEQPATETSPTQSEPEAQPEQIVRTGTFESQNGYTVSGDVQIISSAEGNKLVFSEDFASSIGPDVLVYLTKNDAVADGGSLTEPISLGAIKSFGGTQEYVLPDSIDDYESVVLWCRAFSVSFGAASI